MALSPDLQPATATSAAPADAPLEAAPAAAAAAAPETPAPVNFDTGGSWPVEAVTLDHPFIFAGATYAGYSFRTPSGAEMTAFMGGGLTTVDFAGMLSGLSVSVMAKMHGADFRVLVGKVGAFLR